MDRFTCGICHKKTIAYAPTHIDDNGDALKENIVHDVDKFCKACLIKNFNEKKGCPAWKCDRPYLCPFDAKQFDKLSASAVDSQGDTVMGDADTEYEDRIEGALPAVGDNIADTDMDAYLKEIGLNDSEDESEDDEAADPNYVAPTKNAEVASQNTGLATVVEPVQQATQTTEKVVEETTPKAPRTSPITAEERKKLTIKQLADIEQEIGIPLEHCYYYILSASKKLPNKICVTALDKCKKGADGRMYCNEHIIYGPSEMRSRELTEKKIEMKKMASANKRLRECDKNNQRETLDMLEYEQQEQAKEKVRKTFFDLMENALRAANGQQPQ